MNCAACGTPLAHGYVACPACGMPASPAPDAQMTEPHHDPADRPTESMPAVLLPDREGEPEPRQDHIALAPPLPAPVMAAAPRRRRGGGRRDVVVGALLGTLGALVLIVGAIVLGNLNALDGPDAIGRNSPSPLPAGVAGATGPATAGATEPAAQADGTLSCEPQQISAPGPGRWLFHRANYASRGGRDSFVLNLRRDGDADDTAAVRAELVAPGEVPARYGLDAPAGSDAALVLVLDGPIRVAGPFGDRPGYRTLERFDVVRDGSGTVHAVLALRSNGCFAISAPDWQAGQMPDSTQLTVEIENR